MGQTLAEGLGQLGRFHIVALVDVVEPRELFGATYAASLEDVNSSSIDVVIDFSAPDSVVASATWCATHGVALVIGTTGLSDDQRRSVVASATKVGVVMAPNFSIGAVLSEKFAALAAPFFDSVEIIELHHERKMDAPSGTSLAAAAAIQRAREGAAMSPIVDPTVRHTVAGARGAKTDGGIKVHSIRLPGLVAHQEILFGGPGEGLTIRHDSFDRVSYVAGVAIAADAIDATARFVDGLSALID